MRISVRSIASAAVLALVILVLATVPASAGTVWSDTFQGYTPGMSWPNLGSNWTVVAGSSTPTYTGSVDVLPYYYVNPGSGMITDFNWICQSAGSPAAGQTGQYCIDLAGTGGIVNGNPNNPPDHPNGTTPTGGRIETTNSILLAPGSYALSFSIAGSQRPQGCVTDPATNGACMDNTIYAGIVNAGTGLEFIRNTYFIAGNSQFTTQVLEFVVTQQMNAKIFFDNSDNRSSYFGALLGPTVSLDEVPEPATTLLTGVGLLGVWTLLRRRVSK